MTGPPVNTRIDYMYRDGANFKWVGHAVVRGAPTDDLRARLEAAVENGLFQPHAVGLEELAPWTRDPAELSVMDDDAWHELTGVGATDEPTTDGRTLEAFVDEVEAVAQEGWEDGDPLARFDADVILQLLALKLEVGDHHSALEVLRRAPDAVRPRLTPEDVMPLLTADAPHIRAEALRLLPDLEVPGDERGRSR